MHLSKALERIEERFAHSYFIVEKIVDTLSKSSNWNIRHRDLGILPISVCQLIGSQQSGLFWVDLICSFRYHISKCLTRRRLLCVIRSAGPSNRISGSIGNATVPLTELYRRHIYLTETPDIAVNQPAFSGWSRGKLTFRHSIDEVECTILGAKNKLDNLPNAKKAPGPPSHRCMRTTSSIQWDSSFWPHSGPNNPFSYPTRSDII